MQVVPVSVNFQKVHPLISGSGPPNWVQGIAITMPCDLPKMSRQWHHWASTNPRPSIFPIPASRCNNRSVLFISGDSAA